MRKFYDELADLMEKYDAQFVLATNDTAALNCIIGNESTILMAATPNDGDSIKHLTADKLRVRKNFYVFSDGMEAKQFNTVFPRLYSTEFVGEAIVTKRTEVSEIAEEWAKPTKLQSTSLPGQMMEHKDGMPCEHKGCLNHVSHPCEVCGRIAGEYPNYPAIIYKFKGLEQINKAGKTIIMFDPRGSGKSVNLNIAGFFKKGTVNLCSLPIPQLLFYDEAGKYPLK